jgi:methanogenic corrinoid protein MtbC1
MPGDPLAALRAQYLDAVLGGDARAAISLVADAVRGGTAAEDVCLRVFQPALHEVGERWERGEISVADEHFATATTTDALATVTTALDRRERHANTALVCSTPGERHRLGGRMVADFLDAAGWHVVHQAEAARVEDLVALARAERVDVVALSTSLPWLLPEARRLCVALHALLDPPRVIVGGRAYRGDAHVAELVGADAYAPDPASLLAQLSDQRSAG